MHGFTTSQRRLKLALRRKIPGDSYMLRSATATLSVCFVCSPLFYLCYFCLLVFFHFRLLTCVNSVFSTHDRCRNPGLPLLCPYPGCCLDDVCKGLLRILINMPTSGEYKQSIKR